MEDLASKSRMVSVSIHNVSPEIFQRVYVDAGGVGFLSGLRKVTQREAVEFDRLAYSTAVLGMKMPRLYMPDFYWYVGYVSEEPI